MHRPVRPQGHMDAHPLHANHPLRSGRQATERRRACRGHEGLRRRRLGPGWRESETSPRGTFPQYYKHVGDQCLAVPEKDVPAETHLAAQEFRLARPGPPYTSPQAGAWGTPGPKAGPFTAKLADGSVVTYSWYRFVDQPSFQQYHWGEERKAKLQALVEKIHTSWPIDRDYMAAPRRGSLVSLDPALLVTPPKGLEVGYVPIVTRQSAQ